MAKYAAYFRVSTENQGKSGLGLEAQQEAVQRFLKEGDAIAAEFTEVESGIRTGPSSPPRSTIAASVAASF
jgi:DNA invertase Pin-like site-specific DNA recombinase